MDLDASAYLICTGHAMALHLAWHLSNVDRNKAIGIRNGNGKGKGKGKKGKAEPMSLAIPLSRAASQIPPLKSGKL